MTRHLLCVYILLRFANGALFVVRKKQVCVQPRPSAVNKTLPAFAAVLQPRTAAPLLLGTRRPPASPLSINTSCLHDAQQQIRRTPLLRSNDGTDRRTDGRTDARPFHRNGECDVLCTLCRQVSLRLGLVVAPAYHAVDCSFQDAGWMMCVSSVCGMRSRPDGHTLRFTVRLAIVSNGVCASQLLIWRM